MYYYILRPFLIPTRSNVGVAAYNFKKGIWIDILIHQPEVSLLEDSYGHINLHSTSPSRREVAIIYPGVYLIVTDRSHVCYGSYGPEE